jgi:hypothetical protein
MKYLFQYFFNLPEVRGSASIFGWVQMID